MTRWQPPAHTSGQGLVPLLKEMLAGADDRAPDRPGRHLETPQPLGFLPTLHFWNRRDVWKSARLLTAPVTAASMVATVVIATAVDPWLLPFVGLACGTPVLLAHGLLERYVRRRMRERRRQTTHGIFDVERATD